MIDNPQTDRRERYAAPLYALMRQNGWDGERTEPVVREMGLVLDAVIAVADTELAARRAADLRDAEEICDEAGASYTAKALNEQADGAYSLMARFRRKAEEAEQTAAAPPAVPVPPTTHAGGRAAPVDWIDGHPQLEAIAAAVWEQCRTEGTSLVVDDPRNIAVAAYAAVLPVLTGLASEIRARAFKAAANHVRGHSADERYGRASISTAMCMVSDELYRMADEAQQQPVPGPGRVADEEPAETNKPSPTEALLALRCDACRHTLNRHHRHGACTVVLCVCGRFQYPVEELPQ